MAVCSAPVNFRRARRRTARGSSSDLFRWTVGHYLPHLLPSTHSDSVQRESKPRLIDRLNPFSRPVPRWNKRETAQLDQSSNRHASPTTCPSEVIATQRAAIIVTVLLLW